MRGNTHTTVPEVSVVVVEDLVARVVETEVVVTVVAASTGATRANKATMHAKSVMRFVDVIVVFIVDRFVLGLGRSLRKVCGGR